MTKGQRAPDTRARRETLALLSDSVAHFYGNILTVILGHARLLLEALPRDSAQLSHARILLGAAERGAAFTRQLFNFESPAAPAPRVVNINSSLTEVVELLRQMAGEDLRFHLSLRQELWNVKIDPLQLQQILLGLTASARDAMPGGGDVYIETDNFHLSESRPAPFVSLLPGDYVMLAFTDTGEGPPPDIPEPCPGPQWPGLDKRPGLALVCHTVSELGGGICVEGAPEAGTILRVYLPATREPETAPTTLKSTRPIEASAVKTVLVIEDDPEVLDLTAGMVRELGYRALEALGGPAALDVCRRHPERVDALVTDVVMPVMNGVELAEKIKAIHPDLAVVYATGFPAHTALNGPGGTASGVVIAKPFTKEQLSQALAEAWKGTGKQARILIADDNEEVRGVFRQTLKNHGYTVMDVSTGQQALNVLAREQFDLLITDLVMPDRNGLELIWELRQKRPGLKILAITGRLTDLLAAAQKMGAKGILEKPVRPEALLSKVRSMIGG